MADSNDKNGLRADPLWYKDAIIYQLHVKAFFDWNGDGVGDFPGLTRKLDYLADLGVNTVWLLPFYPSPMRDDGYDIADYHNIATEYGSRGDFRTFMREAHRRGLRVITELVVNHTSDQHPWFQAARRAPAGSIKRNYYVWSDTDKKWPETRIIFTDTESSNWAWDPVAKQYYWHRFFSHQPDLNFNNPQVVKAVTRAMRYWYDMGVDGLRLDAIPYLCERDGTNNENLPETHDVIRQMRNVVDQHYVDRMFLAEANQWPEDVREYFGSGDECHMAYHFPLMPRMYMALAMEDRHPIVEIMRQTPEIPSNCQWAIFLRNHDELTLEMVTDRERDYMYRMYAAEPRMRVNVGIRRRLAPLLDNNRAKIELMTSLLMTMPGSPILYYGDEIGMGDNVFLGDRNGVRTPMQWSPDRNAGFSRADPQRLYLPPVMDALYGYESVNVEAQSRNPSSLLNWTKRLIAVRKGVRAFGRGDLTFLEPGNRKILAYVRSHDGETVLCVANLSHSPQPVELDLSPFRSRVPVELFGKTVFPPVGDLPYLLTLPGYGFYMFRLATDAEVPYWHQDRLPRAELPVLVLVEGLETFKPGHESASEARRLLASRSHTQLARDVIGPYVESKRWYAAKGRKIRDVEMVAQGEWRHPLGSWLLAVFDITPVGADPQTYFLPLGVAWEREGEARLANLGAWTLSRVRQRAEMGILYGALGDDGFCRALIQAMGKGTEVSVGGGRLRFFATSAFGELVAGTEEEPVERPALEQSNTSVFIGRKLFLKGYRRLQVGASPELDMGRFLTETSPFAHIVPVAGGFEFIRDDGATMSLGILQRYVENQGSAWTYSLEYLNRFLAGFDIAASAEQAEPASPHALYAAMMERLGLRVGELHKALAHRSGDPAFDPEPISARELEDWGRQLRHEALETLKLLKSHAAGLNPEVRRACEALDAQRSLLLKRIADGRRQVPKLAKSRYHGDLHLGQVLLVQDDFIITDFEGEPARPLEERSGKHCVLKDVAGMLRSFNYAAVTELDRLTEDRPGDRVTYAPILRTWERVAWSAFLAGYRAGAQDIPTVPQDAAEFETLLQFFVIEKALYEVRYELANRPAWVAIPVRGLLDILGVTLPPQEKGNAREVAA